MRTETCEQIVFRSKSRTLDRGAATEDRTTDSKVVGKYRMEIYRIEIDGSETVFECELTDSIENGRKRFSESFDRLKK